MHRPTIAIVAIALLGIAAGLFLWGPGPRSEQALIMTGCLRVGIVMGALWLAHPQLVRIPTWLYQVGVAVALVAAFRPRILILAAPLLFLAWLIKPRRS